MSAQVMYIVRVMCWFWGLFPLAYYIALTVVCGIYRHWISFSFALATSLVLGVWLLLNKAAMISAAHLNRRVQAAAATRTANFSHRSAPRAYPTGGAVPPALAPTSALLTVHVDADDSPRAFTDDDDDSEVDLSSIPESAMTTAHTEADDTSLSSNASDARQTVPGNPLTAGAGRGRRGLVMRSQPSNVLAAAAAGVDHAQSDGEDNRLLSPPQADAPLGDNVTRAPAQALLPPSSTSPLHAGPVAAKTVGSDSCSVGSGPHDDDVAKLTDGPMEFNPATHSQMASQSSGVASFFYHTAFMMPVVTVYVTLALSVLTLAASILFEYETHCLFLAFPALGVPCLWSTLIPLIRFFDTRQSGSRGFHARLLRVLTHWVCLTIIALVSLAVYVVALALESATWVPYRLKDAPVHRAVRVVSYLSPLPLIIIVFLFVLDNALLAHSVARRDEHRRQRSVRRSTAGVANAGARTTARPPRAAESQFGPLSGFAGTSEDARAPVPNSAVAQGHGLPLVTARSSTSTMPDLEDTNSTLSSIVRSTMGSSIFIPPSSLTASSTRSPSKHHVRASCASSNGSGGLHTVPAAAHVSTLPQLKTVTTLYIAYRNIYDDGDAAHGSFSRGSPQGGMAANRNMQQTISSNYEALMEAIEDAREQGSADDNAYVLTAYEDALCLVWGLMPFSSEPVLLAIEKARQIMEAFRSRPKPPPASTSEQQELVAAVVSAPHSLVGFIGTGNYRSIHFFNPNQHEGGSILLQRSMALYRRLPSIQNAAGGVEGAFSGILMNSRARNNTASQILARPCGIKFIPPPQTNTSTGGAARRLPMFLASKLLVEQFPIMYEFLDFVQAKEEEWHLVVQRQERLGAKFGFLTEATQLLQQGDPKGARELLTRTMESADRTHDADNIVLAQMTLEDLEKFSPKLGKPAS